MANKKAQVNVEESDIDDIKYLGKQEGKNRPILVSFSRTITKKKIFNNLGNLNDILKYTNSSSIVCVYETWSTTLPNIYFSKTQEIIYSQATRVAERGRARGGIMIVLDRNVYRMENLIINENFVIVRIISCNLIFILCVVYISPSICVNTILDCLCESFILISNKFPNDPFFIGGDFNCRIGNLNQIYENFIINNNNLYCYRKSCDLEVGKRGRQLIVYMENSGYMVINGRSVSDFPANYTYVGTVEKSVIDLVWCDLKATQLI